MNWLFGSKDSVTIRPDDILKEGWLSKRSRTVKEWRKRWVVLTATHIYSFKKSNELAYPTEAIPLRECSTVKSAEEEAANECGFRVDTRDRVYLFVADSNSEKEAWIGHIGRRMVRPTVMTEENAPAD
mmetsp:Transcript_33105/g.65709  ORF Transcript_33105/g.65709 Transcript_33105/m.65709 type:complete len:128 (+) Transcript_33105:181-564(+)